MRNFSRGGVFLVGPPTVTEWWGWDPCRGGGDCASLYAVVAVRLGRCHAVAMAGTLACLVVVDCTLRTMTLRCDGIAIVMRDWHLCATDRAG